MTHFSHLKGINDGNESRICWNPFFTPFKTSPWTWTCWSLFFSPQVQMVTPLLVSYSNMFLRPGCDRAASGGRPGLVGKWRQTLGMFLFQHLERTIVASSNSARQTWRREERKNYKQEQIVRALADWHTQHHSGFLLAAGDKLSCLCGTVAE